MSLRAARRPMIALLSTAALAVGVFVGAPSGSAAVSWAPVSSATIHPGVQTYTEGGQCTSNFVFSDGTSVYLGQAAHCASKDGPTATNGCEADSHGIGTPVQIRGASRPGTLVYSSWLTMQASGERDFNTCQYNDFALVKIDAADVGRVNPSVPMFGGPSGLGSGTAFGQRVFSYGNSSLRFGLLHRKTGVSLGQEGGGWSQRIYTVTPGIPGDSGSGFMNADGRAIGVLATVAAAPLPASNGVTNLARALSYMKARTDLDAINLVNGTKPFTR